MDQGDRHESDVTEVFHFGAVQNQKGRYTIGLNSHVSKIVARSAKPEGQSQNISFVFAGENRMSDVADIGSDTTPQFVTESGELQKRAKKKKTNTRKEGNPTERWKQEVGKKGKKGLQ